MASSRPYTFDRVARIFFSVLGIVAVLYILNALKGVLLPFLVSCLIAYMLEPLVLLNRRLLHVRSRVIPVILTLIEISAVLTGACILLIPYLIDEVSQMADILKQYATAKMETPYLPLKYMSL